MHQSSDVSAITFARIPAIRPAWLYNLDRRLMAMVRGSRLLVIDPSVTKAESEGTAAILAGWEGERQVVQPALRPGDGPAPGFGYQLAGVVVMGSAASPVAQIPWLQALKAWLEPVISGETELPLLGICFGHQLLAYLAGGAVGYLRSDRDKEVGCRITELSGGRLLPGRHRLQVIISHREVVHTVPPELRIVGSRPGVPIDAIEHRHLPLFGVQYHPEARADFCRDHGLDFAPVAEQIRSDGNRLLEAFRDLVRHRLRS
jgi:GMP synthase (glutamine-hydrolysing)